MTSLTTTQISRKTNRTNNFIIKAYKTFPYRDIISEDTYKDVVNNFHIEMLHNMIYEGHHYKLPYNLGCMGLSLSKNRVVGQTKEFSYLTTVWKKTFNCDEPYLFNIWSWKLSKDVKEIFARIRDVDKIKLLPWNANRFY